MTKSLFYRFYLLCRICCRLISSREEGEEGERERRDRETFTAGDRPRYCVVSCPKGKAGNDQLPQFSNFNSELNDSIKRGWVNDS